MLIVLARLSGRWQSKKDERRDRPLAIEAAAPPNDTDTFTFDGEGKILMTSQGRCNNTVTFGQAAAGRSASNSLTIDGNTYTVTHSFDQAGRQASAMYPDGSIVSRTVTNRGQLQQARKRTVDLTYAVRAADQETRVCRLEKKKKQVLFGASDGYSDLFRGRSHPLRN